MPATCRHVLFLQASGDAHLPVRYGDLLAKLTALSGAPAEAAAR